MEAFEKATECGRFKLVSLSSSVTEWQFIGYSDICSTLLLPICVIKPGIRTTCERNKSKTVKLPKSLPTIVGEH